MALTRKLLSLGLVARLRPRRMLSFRSETLDRVTLPGVGGRSLACSPIPTLVPEPTAAVSHQTCLWQGQGQAESSPTPPPLWTPRSPAHPYSLSRACLDTVLLLTIP